MNGKNRICRIIDQKSQRFTDTSDEIWAYAETRFTLPRSADALCAALEAEGFQVRRGCSGMEDAFVATWGSGTPVLGFLGEYDALPNLNQEANLAEKKTVIPGAAGHGCGHNLLGAGALAGAVGIKDYMQEAGISGTIRYYGCPAEESGSGKAFMARNGVFEGVDAFLTWHPMTETGIWGISSLANIQVFFTFQGVSAHAAAAPEHGRSALDAAELMNVGVNYLREHIVQEARVHYAYLDVGGAAPNVVQPTAKLLYFIRAPRTAQSKEIFHRVVSIAKGAALMTGTTVELTWDSFCAEYIVNEPLARAMYANLQQLGRVGFTDEEQAFARRYTDQLTPQSRTAFQDKLRRALSHLQPEELEPILQQSVLDEVMPYSLTDEAMPGSTDVGDASWQAPTVQCTVACLPAGTVLHSWECVSCGKSGMAHRGMLYAGKALAMTALDLLTEPELLKKAKADFERRLAGERYDCPIPAEVRPH